jgi:large subunit ribosomal protein L10
MFTESSSAPAKLIQEFRKTLNRPVLKAAYVEESFTLATINLKLFQVSNQKRNYWRYHCLLQSPAKNVLSALQSERNSGWYLKLFQKKNKS